MICLGRHIFILYGSALSRRPKAIEPQKILENQELRLYHFSIVVKLSSLLDDNWKTQFYKYYVGVLHYLIL